MMQIVCFEKIVPNASKQVSKQDVAKTLSDHFDTILIIPSLTDDQLTKI
jgi:hypothetical protein